MSDPWLQLAREYADNTAAVISQFYPGSVHVSTPLTEPNVSNGIVSRFHADTIHSTKKIRYLKQSLIAVFIGKKKNLPKIKHEMTDTTDKYNE